MALDLSAGYDVYTVPNPTGTVTDFTFLVRLTRARNGDLFDACTSSDATKMRLCKGDGATELAFDPFYEDWTVSAEEVILAVLWSGSLTTSGSYELWVTPALSTNTSYGVSDTYGQYNAYSSDLKNYYPEGGGTDRTGNNPLTGYGSISEGDSTGFFGKATSYNGTDQYFSADIASVTAVPITMVAWINPASIYSYRQFLQLSDKDVGTEWFTLAQSTSDTVWFWPRCSATSSGARTESSGAISAGSWFQITGIGISSTSREVRVNNSGSGTTTVECIPADIDRTTIGRDGDSSPGSYFDGLLSHIKIYSAVKSDDFLSYDYSQITDNSTFWGTPIWESGGGTVELVVSGEQDQTGAVALSIPAILSATGEQNQEGTALLSIPATLSITGSQEQSGDVSLLVPAILSALGEQTQAGTITLAGASVLSVLGEQSQAGTLALQIPSRLSVLGEQSQVGDVELAGPPAFTVIGEQGQSGIVALEIPVRLSVLGQQEQDGVISLQIPTQLSVSGEQLQSGTVTIGEITEITPDVIIVIGEIERSKVLTCEITRNIDIDGELV